jgi:CheY-specific phosphatase CheX
MKENKVTFEEIMFSVIAATQDTFRAYLNIEVLAGKVLEKVEPVEADVVGIVGIAGARVGYILFAVDRPTAELVAKRLLMAESADPESIRDSVGELANNIAGALKSKYNEQYGGVALGLPLIMSGKITPLESGGTDSHMRVQSHGVIIPFKSFDADISFKVMVYI